MTLIDPNRSACRRTVSLACLVIGLGLLSGRFAAAEAPSIEPGSWTLAILPDTQVYSERYPQHYAAQTRWIADHAASHNIAFVLHEGDVTEHNTPEQWDHALRAMDTLNGVVPFAISPGNHDYGPGGNSSARTSRFNDSEYFGPGSYYSQQDSLAGSFETDKTDNTFHTFSAGGKEWLVLALEWAPRDEVVAWANRVVTDHPDRLVMLVTHAYMYFDESRYDWAAKHDTQSWNPHAYALAKQPGETINDGQQLWEKLVSRHERFRFTFNGHVLGDGTGFQSSLGERGNAVHQMLANYQFKEQGGMGDMRLLEFKQDGKTVEVRTYSPVLDRCDTSSDQQFTLQLNEQRVLPASPPTEE
ncbi:Calcineurin-like phosphoesterase [Pseudobythopirellula maris]|uniref:Calcineurin-like phosphoesterase n=1 Tax=Pseudobythopirellula maris TaxID=2527991 RepID=A0A5C5ZIM6_9BACT|nr:metallophosphoesterase [Pseudobythopirellula maris]TWT86661.1 Calcineurin-like phosphoesterase [Pseudobythopirellula maris]